MPRRLIFAACVASTAVLASWLDLPHPSRAALPQGRVIGQLIGRDQQITITSGPDGARYSIHRDGKLIAKDLTLEQLRMLDPQACAQIESATADQAPAPWAGIETGE